MDTSIIVALIGVVVSVISWFAGRKERKAKTYSIELENVKKLWDIINYQTARIEELQQEVISLRSEIKRMCINCKYKEKKSIKINRDKNSQNCKTNKL